MLVKAVFKKFLSTIRYLGLDGYVGALFLMILVAYVLPGPGIMRGYFSLSFLSNICISFVFFFYGLRLSPEKLKEGLSNWRLHIVVQLSTFLLFPAIVLTAYYLFAGSENRLFWMGAFFVAALPSTVSSAVVMVSIAGGNIPAAIFNASIASFVGVFLTPLWMGIFIVSGSGSFDATGIILKLALQVLLPVVLGIILHHRFGHIAERHRSLLRLFDQSTILMIVYTSFSESFAKHMFSGHSAAEILLLGFLMALLFFTVYGIITVISSVLGFSRKDRITAVFCGSKKSLVHGTVMSKVLFPDAASAAIIILPIMIYHAIQLVAAGFIARYLSKSGNSAS